MREYKNKCFDCKCKVDNRTKRCSICYRKWREDTKEERVLKYKEYQRKWYKDNEEKVKNSAKSYSKTLSFEERKSYTIKSKYGITIDDFNLMLAKCDFKCQICGNIHSDNEPLHIDHCHRTKKVRGLLCKHCNFGLGNFKDDKELIKNVLKYLENEI